MGDEDMNRREYDTSRISEELSTLKQSDQNHDGRIQKLEINDRLQDRDIEGMKVTLGKIENNTDWIRKTIGKAFISALFTACFALLGGLLIWSLTH